MIRIKNKQYNILGGFLGWMWFALIVIPIYDIVVTSLRDQSEIYSENPLSLPKHFTFDAYGRVFANDFLRYIGNTLFVAVVTVALILLVTVMAAYAITRRADAGARCLACQRTERPVRQLQSLRQAPAWRLAGAAQRLDDEPRRGVSRRHVHVRGTQRGRGHRRRAAYLWLWARLGIRH
ncbi:hypothetical protein RS941_02155 [Bifidobacterium longum]|nr:hypothetical protein [Bifidobacterium longum]MDW3163854.1 hypothetical protein [Bifidobacterium longum]